ncbi:MAG TPA: hypothetical protein VF668_12170 [Pyrinomonadaceae bacterium]|jgi:hypothetical protein
MSRFLLKFTASALALALVSAPAWTGAAAQAPSPAPPGQSYVVIDLTPAGSATSSAAGASGGQQVGSAGFAAATAGQPVVSHAMLWNGSAAGATDLGPGTAAAVGGGQQVGSANNHAALWLGTAASRVDLNPAQWDQSVAAGVAGGRQVGWATRRVLCTTKKGSCSDGRRTEIHPFMWSGSAASAVDLTPLGLGFGAGRALGTDGVQQVGFGQQVLGINAFSGPFAVVWSGTADSAVNLNPPDSGSSQANAVSGGQQVGFGYYPHRALLWSGSAESVVELQPDGFAASEANATNGVQQAGSGFVGDAFTMEGHSHALVWAGSAASAVDLNQFLPPGFTDAAATGIDAAGNVVGWASRGPSDDPANVHAVMWKPVEAGAVFAQSLALSRSSIVAGDAVRATVTLSQPAPQGGAVVTLSRVVAPAADGSASPVTVEMPSAVNVGEGETSAGFDILTGVTTLNGFGRPLLVDIQATYGGATPTATLTVAPPLSLSSLSVAPGSVVGGADAAATITLNGVAPEGGALVALTSDSPAAVAPPSVLVPAGQTAVTFGVRTNAVTAATTATLSATYGSPIAATGTARLVVNPPAAQASDTVSIQRVEYTASKRQLSVQATSSNASARLTVYAAATGQAIGVLGNRGDGRYDGAFSVATNPQNVVVRSSLGGSASRAVTLK